MLVNANISQRLLKETADNLGEKEKKKEKTNAVVSVFNIRFLTAHSLMNLDTGRGSNVSKCPWGSSICRIGKAIRKWRCGKCVPDTKLQIQEADKNITKGPEGSLVSGKACRKGKPFRKWRSAEAMRLQILQRKACVCNVQC